MTSSRLIWIFALTTAYLVSGGVYHYYGWMWWFAFFVIAVETTFFFMSEVWERYIPSLIFTVVMLVLAFDFAVFYSLEQRRLFFFSLCVSSGLFVFGLMVLFREFILEFISAVLTQIGWMWWHFRKVWSLKLGVLFLTIGVSALGYIAYRKGYFKNITLPSPSIARSTPVPGPPVYSPPARATPDLIMPKESEKPKAKSTPEPTPTPVEFSIKEIGHDIYRVMIPTGRWFDTGVPVICNLDCKIRGLNTDENDKFLVKIHDYVFFNNKNPFIENGGLYFNWYAAERNLQWSDYASSTVDYDFQDTIKLKVDDEGSNRPLMLSIRLVEMPSVDPLKHDASHMALHEPHIAWFKNIKARLVRR